MPNLVPAGRSGPHDGRRARSKGLQATIADAHVEILPGAGHMMTVERPNESIDVIYDFLKGGADEQPERHQERARRGSRKLSAFPASPDPLDGQ